VKIRTKLKDHRRDPYYLVSERQVDHGAIFSRQRDDMVLLLAGDWSSVGGAKFIANSDVFLKGRSD
jgi:hypothetical protein